MNPTHVVVSAVNLVEGGTLAVLQDCLAAAARLPSDQVRVTALVHRRELFPPSSVELMEFPGVKGSWGRRYVFERQTSRELADTLRPDLWLALHDMTPTLPAGVRQAVYCHNPLPFLKHRPSDLWLDPKGVIHSMLYPSLYRQRIEKNACVIVQQSWLRDRFREAYFSGPIVVARPESEGIPNEARKLSGSRFLYPSFPRFFKNFQLLLDAWKLLQNDPQWDGHLTVTLRAEEHRYAGWLQTRYGDLKGLTFSGQLTRAQMNQAYETNDCLVFPSRIETWGVPLTEARQHGLSVIAADEPYAHETLSGYLHSHFAPLGAPEAWASAMLRFRNGTLNWTPRTERSEPPFAANWDELWQFLLRTEAQR